MRDFLFGVTGLFLGTVFAMLWWMSREQSTPQLPPSFIEERLVGKRFVPVTERFSKVLAVCPGGLRGSYLMGWAATASYTVDLGQLEISVSDSEPPEILATSPPLELLNDGDNIIGGEDHFWFPRPFALGLRNHYEAEKARAHEIAIASARFRLQNDPALESHAADQIRGLLSGILMQSGVEIGVIRVDIANSEAAVDIPEVPSLCDEQPLAGNRNAEAISSAPAAMTSSEASSSSIRGQARSSDQRARLALEEGAWEAWLASAAQTLSVEAVE